MRTCKQCKSVKEISEYALHTTTKPSGKAYTYHLLTCKVCVRENDRARSHAVMADPLRHAARKAGMKRRQFRAVYGLPLEYKARLLDAQNNRCAICERSEIELVTDHDHKTGKVRKMLCRACNLMIGYCQENTDILQNGIAYLQEHNPSTNTRQVNFA